MAKDWCGECICRYCRWRGTDNCMIDWHCPCDHCRKGSNEFFQCDGYEPSLTGRNKKTFEPKRPRGRRQEPPHLAR